MIFSGKIESLGRLYITSSKYFPLEFLVRKLEVASCSEGGGDYTWVPSCLQNIGVDPPRLLDVYNRIYLAKVRVDPPRLADVDKMTYFLQESVWLTCGDELHILRVLSSILANFAENPGVVSLQDRRQFIVVSQVRLSLNVYTV